MAGAEAHVDVSKRLQQDPTVSTSYSLSGSQATSHHDLNNRSRYHTGSWNLLGSPLARKVLERLDTGGEIVKLPEGVMQPKTEQEMVGFGLREIIGLPRNKLVYPSADTQMVYYATNRLAHGADDHGSVFGKDIDPSTNYGVAEIQCPFGKPLVHRENQAAHSMGLEDFRRSLHQQIAADDKKAVLVYVHGCFTDFGRGVGYGAYILRGLEFKGPMVVFSWPSVGRPSVKEGLVKAVELYRVDEGTCMHSARHLKDLLRFLSKEVGAESVHVVAYSMGARTLIEAMRLFEPEDDLPVTSHLYFIAPDVAAHLFSETLREFRFPGLQRAQALHKQDTSSGAEQSRLETGSGETSPAQGQAQQGAQEGKGFPEADVLHNMVERVADAWNFVGDSVAGLRQLAQAWREARMTGWQDMQEHIVEKWDTRTGSCGDQSAEAAGHASTAESTTENVRRTRGGFSGVGGGVEVPRKPPLPLRNAHVHLYAASNDVALLLSELTDPGIPKIRAGRIKKDFMLCNDLFTTVDVTSLKTGILSTGHFYLFHDIVKEEMAHVLGGRDEGEAWWRQGMLWENGHRYIRLRAIHPQQVTMVQNAVSSWRKSEEYSLQPKVVTDPLFWASP